MAKRAKKVAKKTATKAPGRPAKARAKKAAMKPAAKKYGARADKGAPVDVAINRMPEPMRSIGWAIDAAIRALSKQVDSKVAWGNAGYWVEGHDLFGLAECSDRVNLYIGNGASLADPHRLMEGTGKAMRHVKVRTLELARGTELASLLRAALDASRSGADNAWKMGKKK